VNQVTSLSIKNGNIAFQPRARLLKLIGEELISDEVVAISELVKNAHDADAQKVTISFHDVTGAAGQISIRDDGHGMDRETLLGRWMEPAATTKVGKGRSITRRGRRVLGEKGVGRFAADKLARQLHIISRCPSHSEEIHAVIDWDRFDSDALMLSEVTNRWEVQPAREIQGHGTLLRMSGLRSLWTERMFRRLNLRLARLLSPFRVNGDRFAIHIESDDFPEYSGELRTDFLDRAPYRAIAEFDGEQTISIAFNDRKAIAQRWNGQGELSCGPVKIRIYAFDLEGEALARIGPRMEVRAWLKEWTGVSIYRDGFRVWPYGEPHDDWLRLDQRRVNNPVEKLSNNQVIGFIDIARDRNPDLMDQTNREGLIHNRALEDFRRLVLFVFQCIESERQSIRHPPQRGAQPKPDTFAGAGSLTVQLERLARKTPGDIGSEIRNVKLKIETEALRDAADRQRFVEGYAGLAAVGQMASGLLPVIPHELARIRADLDRIREVVSHRKLPEVREAMADLETCVASVEECLRIVRAATGNADRRRAIDIVAEVGAFRQLVAPLLEARGADIDLTAPRGEVIRTEMRPENFYCLLQILTANSLDWPRENDSPKIRITLVGETDWCEMIFSDNGPGVPVGHAELVFDPLFSRKEGGRGMGLTIARQMVEAHGGQITLLTDARRRGANFLIRLPRKRSRATIYDS
jgi:signal transduction histidine kinase